MKTFQEFMSLCEATYDPEVQGRSQITGPAAPGGRIGRERKKTPAERTKAEYKPRKDIGVQRPRSTREQQPEKERGSAALSAKEAQRKAYLERKRREAGEKTKSASELLSKKAAPKAPAPGYKPHKARFTGKEGRAERKKLTRAGEAELERLVRQGEAKKQGVSPQNVKLKNFKKSERAKD